MAKPLLRRIEHYLKRRRTAPSRFGLDAVNDASFVFDLRKGRKVTEEMASRVHQWLDRECGRND